MSTNRTQVMLDHSQAMLAEILNFLVNIEGRLSAIEAARSSAASAADILFAWLETRQKTTSVRDAHIAMRRYFPRVANLRDALRILEEEGYVRVQMLPAGPRGGRPSARIEIAAPQGRARR